MVRVLHPQEIQAFYILPAVRRAIALELKNKGMAQNKISELIGITPAAVTYYVQSKRAGEIKLDDKTKKEIQKLIRKARTFHAIQSGTQKIINNLWKERHICCVCHDVNKTDIKCVKCFEEEKK